MDPDTAVQNFREALIAGYPSWLAAATEVVRRERIEIYEFFDDWAESLWELLVERSLLGPEDEFLEIYGTGSEYGPGPSSRAFFRDALPTHEIYVASAQDHPAIDVFSGESIILSDLVFDMLVCVQDGKYDIAPPFDHALMTRRTGSDQYAVPLAEVTFRLRPTSWEPARRRKSPGPENAG